MPRYRIVLLVICAGFLLQSTAAMAQGPVAFTNDPLGPEGGPVEFQDTGPHLTDAQREAIQQEVEQNLQTLAYQGAIPPPSPPPALTWPLRAAAGFEDYGYHGISNFVDHQGALNFVVDYACGSRSYDIPGYNHQGTDIFLWPFYWLKMDTDAVEVVASAPGIIIYRSDGNYDRSCGFGGGNWNAIYVRHDDGSRVWYGHMKNGSVTPKHVGERVARGEYLGVVGSSGNSTGPHLHLELYNAVGSLNDPFAGECNWRNPRTWWQKPPPYYDPAVNHLATNWGPPSFPVCPQQEQPRESDQFVMGERVYFVTYYRDQLRTRPSRYRILRPDGTVFAEWTHHINPDHYAASYWYWWWDQFAPQGPAGEWRFQVFMNHRRYETTFRLTYPQ